MSASDPYPAYPKPKYPRLQLVRQSWPTGVEGRGVPAQCPECKTMIAENFMAYCDSCDGHCCTACASANHLKKKDGHKVFWFYSPVPWIPALQELTADDLKLCIKTNCGCPRYAHEDGTGVCHFCLLRDNNLADMKQYAGVYFCLSYIDPEDSVEVGMNEIDRLLRTFDECASKTTLKVPVAADDIVARACQRKYGWLPEYTMKLIKECLEAGRLQQVGMRSITVHDSGPTLVRPENWQAFLNNPKRAK